MAGLGERDVVATIIELWADLNPVAGYTSGHLTELTATAPSAAADVQALRVRLRQAQACVGDLGDVALRATATGNPDFAGDPARPSPCQRCRAVGDGDGRRLCGSGRDLWARTEQEATDQLLFGLQRLLDTIADLRARDLYVFGESFAGTYIPMLATAILASNARGGARINLKGIGVGDGWVCPALQKRPTVPTPTRTGFSTPASEPGPTSSMPAAPPR